MVKFIMIFDYEIDIYVKKIYIYIEVYKLVLIFIKIMLINDFKMFVIFCYLLLC